MEQELKELTDILYENCVGRTGDIVIGASLNMINTALNGATQEARIATAQFLRGYADRLEGKVE